MKQIIFDLLGRVRAVRWQPWGPESAVAFSLAWVFCFIQADSIAEPTVGTIWHARYVPSESFYALVPSWDALMQYSKESEPEKQVAMKLADTDQKKHHETYDQADVIRVRGFLPEEFRNKAFSLSGGERFILPMDGRVTSRFGYRKHPSGGGRRYHHGVDIASASGSPIRAAASGRVKTVSRSWSKGLYVVISHADGYETTYFHLRKAVSRKGWNVAQGEIIGLEGSSGNTTGPHLHFEIIKNGLRVDPELYLPELSKR